MHMEEKHGHLRLSFSRYGDQCIKLGTICVGLIYVLGSLAVMGLTTVIEGKETYYDVSAGWTGQPTYITFNLTGVVPTHYFIDWRLHFIRNINMDGDDRSALCNLTRYVEKDNEPVEFLGGWKSSVKVTFRAGAADSSDLILLYANADWLNQAFATVQMEQYMRSIMGVSIVTKYVAAAGTNTLRKICFVLAFGTIYVAILYANSWRNHNRMGVFHFCALIVMVVQVLLLNPLAFFDESESMIKFDKYAAQISKHLFRLFVILNLTMGRGESMKLISMVVFTAFFAIACFVDMRAGMRSIICLQDIHELEFCAEQTPVLLITCEIIFIGLIIYAYLKRCGLSPDVRIFNNAIVVGSILFSLSLIGMIAHRDIISVNGDLVQTVMHCVLSGLFSFVFLPEVGFEVAVPSTHDVYGDKEPLVQDGV